jgi:hypothetical protein
MLGPVLVLVLERAPRPGLAEPREVGHVPRSHELVEQLRLRGVDAQREDPPHGAAR